MEKAFKFGEKKNLVGILSEPDDVSAQKEKPLVIILNSGFVHRPGTFRMNKEFSLFIAEQGYSSFRFDLSGIGDSDKLPMDSMNYKERNLSDVGEAIAFLKETVSSTNFIVMGLCTGADLAHQAVAKYDDVCGSILLDGYGYPTFNFYLKRFGPILLSPARIFGVLKRVVSVVLPNNDSSESHNAGVDAYYWVLPEKQVYAAEMDKMHQAGKKHFYGYSGGVTAYYNYENQLVDAFKSNQFISDVEVVHFKHSDHTYTLLSQRRKLFSELLRWLNAL